MSRKWISIKADYDDEQGKPNLNTIVYVWFLYKDKSYACKMDFGKNYGAKYSSFYFNEGNYSCDCNRSSLIKKFYPEFKEKACGKRIEMIGIEVRYEEPKYKTVKNIIGLRRG